MDDATFIGVHRFERDILAALFDLCRHFCGKCTERLFSFFAVVFNVNIDSGVLASLVVFFVGGEIDEILERFQRVTVVTDQRGRALSGDGDQRFAVSVVVNHDLTCNFHVSHQGLNEASGSFQRL